MCVISCASFVPDKSGRHFLSSSVALSLRGGGERVHGCFVGVGRHVAARPPAAIGTFSNDKRGEMDRKTAKKTENDRTGTTAADKSRGESPSKRERAGLTRLRLSALPHLHLRAVSIPYGRN